MMWLGGKKSDQKIAWMQIGRMACCRRSAIYGSVIETLKHILESYWLESCLGSALKSVRTIGQEPIGLEMLRTTRIASADTLWRIVNNLADLETWHPLVVGTDAPRGQQAKPGLIYRTMSRYLPISTQVFVERVLPGELVSMRLFPLPGLQERVTYRIVSTLCGTCVLYSITLSGWLSPLAWPVVKPQATKVAAALVAAAEMETMGQWRDRPSKRRSHLKADIFE